MPEKPDPTTIESEIDQIINRINAQQAEAMNRRLAAAFVAGKKSVKTSSMIFSRRLTNLQRNAIRMLAAEQFGYLSEFNIEVGLQIKRKAAKLLDQEKGYKEISSEIRKYATDVFDGSEKVVIDRTGQTRKIIEVTKDLELRQVEKVITRPYVTNVNAYSDMLARTSVHGAYEEGRAAGYQSLGIKRWRFIGPHDERGRPDHIALLGQVFEYGTQQSKYAQRLLHEPNCRHRAVAYFADSSRNTKQDVFDKQKEKAGLYWDDGKGKWDFKGWSVGMTTVSDKG